MTTSTSLNLRALLKTAIARSGMDVPARVVSGLTPAAKALFVAGAASSLPHGVVLYVVPSDADLEQAVADVSLLPGRARRAVRHGGRSRGPAVPVARSRSVPRAGAARRRDVGARAGAARASRAGTARVVVASAAALLPRVSAPDRLLGASLELEAGPGHRADRSRRSCSSTPASRARIRPTSTASSRSAAASSTSFRPARRSRSGSSSSATRSSRCAATIPRRSGRSRRSIRSRSCRCTTCCR